MPAYPKPPEQWLANHLRSTGETTRALSAASTMYVMEPVLLAAPNSEGHYYEEKCVAIIGNVEYDNEQKPTGLTGWGIASKSSGTWKKL